jgi:hypothetical protein
MLARPPAFACIIPATADKLMGAGVATNPHCPGSNRLGPRGARFFFAGAEFPPRHRCRFGSPVPVPAEALLPRSVPVRVLSFSLAAFRIVPFRVAARQSPTGSLQAAIEASFDRYPFEFPLKRASPGSLSRFLHPPCSFAFFPSPKLGAAGLPFGKWVRHWLSPLPRASSLGSPCPPPSDAPLILSDIRRLFRRGNVLEPSSVLGFRRSRSAAPGHICKLTGAPESRQHNQPVDK